jgi:hypothetical protein
MSNVTSWLLSNLTAILLLSLFLMISAYAVWLRIMMRVSKARFALAALAAMVSCVVGLFAFLSGPIPIQIANAILSAARAATGIESIPKLADDPNWLTMLLGSAAAMMALVLIYKFSVTALRLWDGPVTITVNELAKHDQDNSIALLAFAEARRLLAAKGDPLASEVAINWQQRHSDAPSAPVWHLLARQLFEAAFSEALFSNSGWRDRFQVWIGEIYLSQPQASDTAPLVLFVFEEEPDYPELIKRIDAYTADGASLAGAKVFAIFNCGSLTELRTLQIRTFQVEMWSRQGLLRRGLKFTAYARDLIKRFDKDVLGGTKATLADTFVKAHVMHRASDERKPLEEILDTWISENSRRQLAITGEYGQGKSTAMLEFCVRWAKQYLANPAIAERVPLLIELRGQNPAENDPITFLSGWAARYGLSPTQLYNLVRAGEAILIFEGFDELRNAGRAYDRHEHFNALWRLAYPGTKVIFTGRPNFFLDEKEKNRTLRNDAMSGAAGNPFTELWEIDRLKEDEVRQVVSGFGEALGVSIMAATAAHPAFFEIVSRPSMLPVVATIWDKIALLQQQGHNPTSAVLLELYLQAIYRRKEQEIENDQQVHAAPEGASYLLLPREVREFFSLAIVWKMADTDARNTIGRAAFDGVISQLLDDVFRIFQSEGIRPEIIQKVRAFEERFKDETRGDRLERVSNEVASSGLFVSDPAGGPSNLRLPHKQFYEYLIAKAGWMVLAHRKTMTSKLFQIVARSKSPFEKLLSEELSLQFFSEIIESNFTVFKSFRLYLAVSLALAQARILDIVSRLVNLIRPNNSSLGEKIYSGDPRETPETRVLLRIVKLTVFSAVPLPVFLVVLGKFRLLSPVSEAARREELFDILTFIPMALLPLLVVLAPNIFSFPAFIAFRKILYSQLKPIFHLGGDRLTILAFNQECVLTLSNSSRSAIAREQSKRVAVGESQAQREYRESIYPLV